MNETDREPEKPGAFMQFMQWVMPKITPGHVWAYRKLNGRFVNRATGGAPAILVTTRGRRTRKQRTVVVGCLHDEDDLIVAGTNGGLRPLPGWVHNLRADPQAEVQIGGQKFRARAEFLEGDDWERDWERLLAAYPMYDQAQRWAGRKVPLIRLRRTG